MCHGCSATILYGRVYVGRQQFFFMAFFFLVHLSHYACLCSSVRCPSRQPFTAKGFRTSRKCECIVLSSMLEDQLNSLFLYYVLHLLWQASRLNVAFLSFLLGLLAHESKFSSLKSSPMQSNQHSAFCGRAFSSFLLDDDFLVLFAVPGIRKG